MKNKIPSINGVYLKQFEQDLEDILYELKNYYPNFKKSQEEFIRRVFWFACEAHKTEKRFSGEPYFTHPIAATKILLSIKPDIETVSACLLHDVIEDTPILGDEIEKEFGKNIRFLCEGVEKITKIRLKGKEREFESLKKLFVAMAKDIRVIFIKLADRIHNLQTLQFVRKEKQIRISKESSKIYAPVASKLGLFEFKIQIEDLCFSYLHPEIYQDLSNQIKQTQNERKIFVEKAKKEIKKYLAKEKIHFLEIQGRPKNIYSVYEKIKRKNFTSVNEIYDLMAIRIVVDELSDCYRTLGVIHSIWKPIPRRFKDYIAVPKPNGYQSLHTTILGLAKSKLPTEIQIRTEKMHLDAEFGPAAHWAYKQKKSSNFDANYVKTMDWIPQNIIFRQSQEESAEEFFEEISKSFSRDRIHIFTPKGEIKSLPAKSTPVDFAFAIHSEIGQTCVGAKVNGTIKSLNYELKTGDVVEILTKKGKQINPLWLDFVKSSHAKNQIKNYLNKVRQEDKTLEDNIILKKKEDKLPKTKKKLVIQKVKKKNSKKIIIGGESNIPYKMGNCCKNIKGEEIIAYKSRGLEFTIHKINCKILKNLDSARFVDAHFQWLYNFNIIANDRVGLLRDYANIIGDCGINIISFKFSFDKEKNISTWNFTIEANSNQEIIELMIELKKIPNVIEIVR